MVRVRVYLGSHILKEQEVDGPVAAMEWLTANTRRLPAWDTATCISDRAESLWVFQMHQPYVMGRVSQVVDVVAREVKPEHPDRMYFLAKEFEL